MSLRRLSCLRLSALACALGVSCLGCAGTPAAPTWGWPLAKKEVDAPPSPPTPAERIQAFRKLSKEAAKMPPAEQEALAQRIVQAANSEQDSLLRCEMMRTLGSLPTLSSGSALYAGIQDSDPDVRVACCEAWARRGGPDAAKVLGELIKNDQSAAVRLAAIRWLGEVRDPSSVPSIAVALEDPNPALQWRAVRSLEQVTGKYFGEDVNAWRSYVQGGKPREESLVSRLRRMMY